MALFARRAEMVPATEIAETLGAELEGLLPASTGYLPVSVSWNLFSHSKASKRLDAPSRSPLVTVGVKT